ncbi:MAG TPA: cobalamin biosynthesis protein CbiM [Ruminococcaceae bacterium]|nr:cobalamin biosynthesis protein CbiM [Oscillospiraceae bacterium]
MHMADALISPLVGGVMTAASVGTLGYSLKKAGTDINQSKIPLMAVTGALVFSAQMINFTIPATGSSGHIGGGLLLASLLGPFEGFITIAVVLLIQALFFADGGLLAYGCNLFNMGFYSCFIAYPFIFKAIVKKGADKKRIVLASVLASVVGLQLGAFSVVLETLFSGKTELPFSSFVLLMQPIHLAIGAVEGVITAAVLIYINQYKPELLNFNNNANATANGKRVIASLAVLALLCGGLFSLFASSYPDGLEWSIQGITGSTELEEADTGIHSSAAAVQQKTSFMPDYTFANAESETAQAAGTSAAGIIGSGATFVLVATIGGLVYYIKSRKSVK